MTSEISGPECRRSAKKQVRFFNVSLRNGIVMSTPAYPEKQAFVAHLIRALETSNPDFAWIQFLFVRSDYGAALVRLKNSMHRAKIAIEQPSLDLISGQERDRRELHRDYYRRADARMKKVDDIVTKPTITMAIQGMWVSDEPDSSSHALPFDHCSDEHDSLAVFQYRDPRMLLELVDRRMVADISEYLDRYTRSRLEPPSFLVTPEELQSYVHLPAGELAASLRSLEGGTSTRGFTQAKRRRTREADPAMRRCHLVKAREAGGGAEDGEGAGGQLGPASRPPRIVDGEDVRAGLLRWEDRGAALRRDGRGHEEVRRAAQPGLRRHEVREGRAPARLSEGVARGRRPGRGLRIAPFISILGRPASAIISQADPSCRDRQQHRRGGHDLPRPLHRLDRRREDQRAALLAAQALLQTGRTSLSSSSTRTGTPPSTSCASSRSQRGRGSRSSTRPTSRSGSTRSRSRQGSEVANRVQVLQTQVEELSALLSDVFNTDAATAPRLMWVFKGALYYLYTLDDNPTFKDLYRILVDFISHAAVERSRGCSGGRSSRTR